MSSLWRVRWPFMTEQGFSFLEVMVALAILAIALPVLLGLRNRDLELQYQARQQTMATLLAQKKLLETELLGFLPLGEQEGKFYKSGQTLAVPMQTQPEISAFKWKRTVLPTPLASLREVRIRIAWPRGEFEEALEVRSYVFREAGSPR